MKKFHIPYVEFYITHVCNYSCQGCNRFNNYYFSGSQLWKDHEKIYQQWSERVDIPAITILGGEPTLNPDLMNWVHGLKKLWPNSILNLTTNGSRLHLMKELYDEMARDPTHSLITVSLHDHALKENILKFLKEPLTKIDDYHEHPLDNKAWKISYLAIKDPTWPDCDHWEDFKLLPKHIQDECTNVHKFNPEIYIAERTGIIYQDANGVKMIIKINTHFTQSALILNADSQSFSVHNSNPIQAHQNCSAKACHQIRNGKIYKCGVVDLLPEFDSQFQLTMSEEDRKIMYSYVPGEVDFTDSELEGFINELNNPIAQCKFCPEHYVNSPINPTAKKPKIFKIKNINE